MTRPDRVVEISLTDRSHLPPFICDCGDASRFLDYLQDKIDAAHTSAMRHAIQLMTYERQKIQAALNEEPQPAPPPCHDPLANHVLLDREFFVEHTIYRIRAFQHGMGSWPYTEDEMKNIVEGISGRRLLYRKCATGFLTRFFQFYDDESHQPDRLVDQIAPCYERPGNWGTCYSIYVRRDVVRAARHLEELPRCIVCNKRTKKQFVPCRTYEGWTEKRDRRFGSDGRNIDWGNLISCCSDKCELIYKNYRRKEDKWRRLTKERLKTIGSIVREQRRHTRDSERSLRDHKQSQKQAFEQLKTQHDSAP